VRRAKCEAGRNDLMAYVQSRAAAARDLRRAAATASGPWLRGTLSQETLAPATLAAASLSRALASGSEALAGGQLWLQLEPLGQ
jgi:hypothetical protein